MLFINKMKSIVSLYKSCETASDKVVLTCMLLIGAALMVAPIATLAVTVWMSAILLQ